MYVVYPYDFMLSVICVRRISEWHSPRGRLEEIGLDWTAGLQCWPFF